MNHTRLSEVIGELCKGETPDRSKVFTDEIRSLERNDEWVWQLVRDAGKGNMLTAQLRCLGRLLLLCFQRMNILRQSRESLWLVPQ